MRKIVFFIFLLLLGNAGVAIGQDATPTNTPLQQQLQRLQSAVQQARQGTPTTATQPAFLPTPPQQQGGVPPPVGPATTNVSPGTITTTTGTPVLGGTTTTAATTTVAAPGAPATPPGGMLTTTTTTQATDATQT